MRHGRAVAVAIEENEGGGQRDERSRQARELAQHGQRTEQKERAVGRHEQRRVTADRGERAKAHRATGGSNRSADVGLSVGHVARHDVHCVVDANAQGDRERDEVRENDLRPREQREPGEPQNTEHERAEHDGAGESEAEDSDHRQRRHRTEHVAGARIERSEVGKPEHAIDAREVRPLARARHQVDRTAVLMEVPRQRGRVRVVGHETEDVDHQKRRAEAAHGLVVEAVQIHREQHCRAEEGSDTTMRDER